MEKSGAAPAAIGATDDHAAAVQLDAAREERFAIVDEISAKFAAVPGDDLETEIIKAVAAARAEKRRDRVAPRTLMRAVLDTNVLASGVIRYQERRSAPAQLFAAWRAGAFSLVLSEYILDELSRALAQPYFVRVITPEEIKRLLTLLRTEATIAAVPEIVAGVASHPEDDPMQEYQGVRIIGPRAFLELLGEQGG